MIFCIRRDTISGEEVNNTINEYITPDNKIPYSLWLDNLKDNVGKARIISQVDRMELGIFGDSEPVGEGVSELKIHYGPGYRIYYAKEGKNIYLLCGGNKSSQKKDIKLAKQYWKNYKKEVHSLWALET